MDNDQKFIIDAKVATEILNYLVNKPYIEVFQLVQGLQAIKPAPKEEIK